MNNANVTNAVSQAVPPVDIGAVTTQDVFNYVQGNISESFATIKSKFYGKENKAIIHIQDSHANYEAQVNLIKILKNLKRSKIGPSMKLVAVEGAEGPLNVAQYVAYPDNKIKHILVKQFLKKGFLSGAEAFAIEYNYPDGLYGIENRDLYLENLGNFRNAQKTKNEVLGQINILKNILAEIQKQVFLPEVNQLFAEKEKFNTSEISITGWCGYITTVAKKLGVNVDNMKNIREPKDHSAHVNPQSLDI